MADNEEWVRVMTEQMTVSETGAMRANGGKLRVSAIPPEFIVALAGVLSVGSVKYDLFNWEKGLNALEILDSMMRHYLALRSGEIIDAQTGCHHSSLIAVNALMFHTMCVRNGAFEQKYISDVYRDNSFERTMERETANYKAFMEEWNKKNGRA